MAIGENIKKQRTKLGITQKELGDQLFVSYQAVSRWENGEVEPSLDTIKKMCEIFKCEINDLVYGEELIKKENEETSSSDPIIIDNKEETKEITYAICDECGRNVDKTTLKRVNISKNEGLLGEAHICEHCVKEHTALTDKKNQLLTQIETLKPQRFGVGDNDSLFALSYKTIFIWSLIAAILAVGVALAVLIPGTTNIGLIVGLTIASFYLVFAELYSIFQDTIVCSVFLGISKFSIKMPGLIFSLDLDGIISMIVIKIGLGILSAILGLLMFIFGVVLSTLIAAIAFPFYLIKHFVVKKEAK